MPGTRRRAGGRAVVASSRPLTGATRVAGVTQVTWSGQLRAAHLIVRSDVEFFIDDASVRFLPAQIGRWGFDNASHVAADTSGFRRHGAISGARHSGSRLLSARQRGRIAGVTSA